MHAYRKQRVLWLEMRARREECRCKWSEEEGNERHKIKITFVKLIQLTHFMKSRLRKLKHTLGVSINRCAPRLRMKKTIYTSKMHCCKSRVEAFFVDVSNMKCRRSIGWELKSLFTSSIIKLMIISRILDLQRWLLLASPHKNPMNQPLLLLT